MVRLDAETKQITHAIRMAAYNAETILARALDGHYARARDEAYALIREALATSGDIHPGPGQLLIRLDPLTAPRRTQAMAALCDQLNHAGYTYPRHRPHPALRGQAPPRPCMIFCPMSRVLGLLPPSPAPPGPGCPQLHLLLRQDGGDGLSPPLEPAAPHGANVNLTDPYEAASRNDTSSGVGTDV